MNKFLLGSSFALALGFAAVIVAEEPAKGSPVTITGCVVGGDGDSYVLTHVQKISPQGDTTTTASLGANGMEASEDHVYWLSHDSLKHIRGHVGHKLEITGKISDVSMGSVQVREEPGRAPGRDNKVEVDARGKEATGRTDRPVKPGPTPAPGTKVEEKKTLPAYRIEVDTVKMISATCP